MMLPEMDPDKLKRATDAYFQKDWNAMLDINLSLLEENAGNEFLIWHVADNYLKLGNTKKAMEFAEKLPEGDVHRDDIFMRAAHLYCPDNRSE